MLLANTKVAYFTIKLANLPALSMSSPPPSHLQVFTWVMSTCLLEYLNCLY